ncbi:hypothetical protein D3C80_1769040 [compost metagenome]
MNNLAADHRLKFKMLKVFPFRLIKLPSVAIRDKHKSVIDNFHYHVNITCISTLQNFHQLTELRFLEVLHLHHLRIQLSENFHAVRCNSYCMLKVGT